MEAEPPPIKVSGAWRVKPHSLGEPYGLTDSVYPKTQVPKGSLQTRFVRWFMVVREGFLSTQNYLSKGSLWIAKWILVFFWCFFVGFLMILTFISISKTAHLRWKVESKSFISHKKPLEKHFVSKLIL